MEEKWEGHVRQGRRKTSEGGRKEEEAYVQVRREGRGGETGKRGRKMMRKSREEVKLTQEVKSKVKSYV